MILRSTVSRWDMFKFLLMKVPTVLWAGIKVDLLDHSHCKVSIRRSWRNRNPYNGVYFANVLTAAEMASGLMVFDEILQAEDVAGIKVAAIISSVNVQFIRPVKGAATVCCRQARQIEVAVLDAIKDGRASVLTHSTVHNDRGRLCADVEIIWTLKRVAG